MSSLEKLNSPKSANTDCPTITTPLGISLLFPALEKFPSYQKEQRWWRNWTANQVVKLDFQTKENTLQ